MDTSAHVHDEEGCCECGDHRHCCCDCPVFREPGADPDVTQGRPWETVYPPPEGGGEAG